MHIFKALENSTYAYKKSLFYFWSKNPYTKTHVAYSIYEMTAKIFDKMHTYGYRIFQVSSIVYVFLFVKIFNICDAFDDVLRVLHPLAMMM